MSVFNPVYKRLRFHRSLQIHALYVEKNRKQSKLFYTLLRRFHGDKVQNSPKKGKAKQTKKKLQ